MNEEWQMWADMIRSDQMTAQQVQQFLEDHPDFRAWYMNYVRWL